MVYLWQRLTELSMRTSCLIPFSLVCLSLLSVLTGCKKPVEGEFPLDNVALVETRKTTLTDTSSGIGGGTVINNGGYPVTERGVCWSISLPTTNNLRSIDGSGIGSFESELGLLKADQVYFVRAYAINEKGVGYGGLDSVYTNTGVLPFIRTAGATEIRANKAILNGRIGFDGIEQADKYGFCYSTSPNPDTSDIVVFSNVNGTKFTKEIFNITDFTPYYVRAFCINQDDINYGNQVSFVTQAKTCSAPLNIFDFAGNEIITDSIQVFGNFSIGLHSKTSLEDTSYTGWNLIGSVRFPSNPTSGEYFVLPYSQFGSLDSNQCMIQLLLEESTEGEPGQSYTYEAQEGSTIILDRVTTNISVVNVCNAVYFSADTNHTFQNSFRFRSPTNTFD